MPGCSSECSSELESRSGREKEISRLQAEYLKQMQPFRLSIRSSTECVFISESEPMPKRSDLVRRVKIAPDSHRENRVLEAIRKDSEQATPAAIPFHASELDAPMPLVRLESEFLGPCGGYSEFDSLFAQPGVFC